MNITDFLDVMDFTPEEDRAILYATSATVIFCSLYNGIFITKKVCGCLIKKIRSKAVRSSIVEPEPFEPSNVEETKSNDSIV